jgi:mRNA interferase MazF
MGQFARGAVVPVKFPFSDLSRTKLRPALVLAEVDYGDVLLSQITEMCCSARSPARITAIGTR